MKILCGLFLALFALSTQASETIAVFPLKNNGGLSDQELNIFYERILYELGRRSSFTVVERAQINEILKEQGFQASGACSDDACLVEMGRVLAVRKALSGSIGKIGGVYAISLKLVNIESAAIERHVMNDVRATKKNLLSRHIPFFVKQLADAGASQPAAPSAKSVQKTRRRRLWVTAGGAAAAAAAAAIIVWANMDDGDITGGGASPTATLPETDPPRPSMPK